MVIVRWVTAGLSTPGVRLQLATIVFVPPTVAAVPTTASTAAAAIFRIQFSENSSSMRSTQSASWNSGSSAKICESVASASAIVA